MIRRAATVAIGAAVVAVYLLRIDPAAGLYVDDAWYMVLAQSLARGEGFRLISSATAPIVPAVPPGFPLLLAPVFAVLPRFPDNVVALKMISVVAMLAVGIAAYRFASRAQGASPQIAAAVALLTVLQPSFVFLATSTVMSEPVFMLSILALALVVERVSAASTSRHRDWGILAAGVLGGTSMLIRSAGIAMVGAATLYLLMRRGWRTAAVFAAAVVVTCLPWFAYSATHASSFAERELHGGSIAFRYDELLMMRRGGEAASGRINATELPSRVAANLVEVFTRDSAALLFPAGYRGPDESGREIFDLSGETGLRASGMGLGAPIRWMSGILSVLMLVGFARACRSQLTVAELMTIATVAMVVLVPARTFRYVAVIAPFLLFYMLRGIEAVAAVLSKSRDRGATLRVVAASAIVLFAIEHAQYIAMLRGGQSPSWLRDYAEARDVTGWIRSTAQVTGPVASTNPGLVYLATARKTVALTITEPRWRQLRELGVVYAATLTTSELPPPSLGYAVVHESPQLRLWVVELSRHGSGDRK